MNFVLQGLLITQFIGNSNIIIYRMFGSEHSEILAARYQSILVMHKYILTILLKNWMNAIAAQFAMRFVEENYAIDKLTYWEPFDNIITR